MYTWCAWLLVVAEVSPVRGLPAMTNCWGADWARARRGRRATRNWFLKEGNRDIGIGFLGQRMGAGGWGSIPS